MGNPVPVAPSLEPVLDAVLTPREDEAPNRRTLRISALAIIAAFLAALAAQLLTRLIGLITNVAFYGRWSMSFVSPSDNSLGMAVVIVPIIGAVLVGVMARYGSAAIRGHGIPEAMEQVLLNESRISPKVMFLKPLSAAISIGTGGPFGAEGPIIATGGALGSVIGQLFHITADERKTLLAAGAAAGMAATFGTPVAAVLLAVELLLFEYRPRSLIPVSLAAATATGVRIAFVGAAPVFPMPNIAPPSGEALATYIALGAAIGVVAVFVTRGLYGVEDLFEQLPIHWMWWPAIGAVVVGVVGYFAPRTLGVGYENIEQMVAGSIAGRALLILVTLKLVSWIIALGSGTSGGTLAPLFTIGGGAGALAGGLLAQWFPSLGVDPRIAALVGMAAIFAGASHAVLASVVFAFETTRQPLGLLPLLAGCSAAYLVSLLGMRHSIMTEKLARRGTRIRSEYAADFLEQVLVREIASTEVVTLPAEEPVEEVRDRIAARTPGSQHQGFPVVNARGDLVGVVTRRDLLDLDIEFTALVGDLVKRAAVVIYDDSSAREAADHMVHERVGRLPVVARANPRRVIGIVSRSDLLEAHERRLHAGNRVERTIDLAASFAWVRPNER
ncbi:MAG TPA: chloride channel protein [Gemmatimonadaceae bacterium]|jgi:CIC family chloride channel protein|nr:chloride channel protein [Gemmatimonadaceae bacterium]